MKLAIAILLTSLASLVHADIYSWGNVWSIGLNSTINIAEATTTFTPGTTPPDQSGELYLWPGMTNGTGDLLQTTIESWESQTWCGGDSSQWCLRTSVYSTGNQSSGSFAPVNPSNSVTINFQRSADNLTWTQTALIDGQIISQHNSSSGPMTGWGVAIECEDYCAGTIQAQTYTNTTIVLYAADPNFGDRALFGTAGNGTVVSGLASPDGGKTWNIDEIDIPAM